MKPTPLLLLALAGFASQANASSTEAWNALDKAVIDSCVKVSQLKNPKPAGAAALFDDTVGFNALLIKGQYKQAFMKNKTGTELCLYDRKTKKAVSTEWDNLTTRPKQ
ncbi:hypothetical protein [Pseudomonas huanghezhanensis]|uniref:hypothetical protein n=1 Tax=Pseudomonas huanghezhanensis TaxID=3002903 RepID=UPI002285C1A4|nr:hypothetical protein [Pseudomonas sp. BSw22131]